MNECLYVHMLEKHEISEQGTNSAKLSDDNFVNFRRLTKTSDNLSGRKARLPAILSQAQMLSACSWPAVQAFPMCSRVIGTGFSSRSSRFAAMLS